MGPEPDAVDALEADVDGTRTVVGVGLQGRLRARDGRRVRGVRDHERVRLRRGRGRVVHVVGALVREEDGRDVAEDESGTVERVREDVRPPREPRVDEHRPVVGLDRGRVEAIRAVARLERQREHVLVRRLRVDVGVGRHP